jgi:hypothetical protein
MSQFTPERVCADCARESAVMVGMRPGVDGKEWFLCRACHVRSTAEDPPVTLDSVKATRPRAVKRERQGQH